MATQQRERNSFNSLVDSAKDNAGDAMKDTANRAGDMAKDTANRAGDIAKDTASKAGDLAKDLAGRAGDFVKDAASSVANTTTDAASYVAKKADDATVAVGENISSLAGTIRAKGPRDGIFGAADSAVADTVACVGKELEQGLGGMTDDLTQTIRRHPVPSVLIGIGIGFVIARAFSK
jgi:gas vesicle protein